MSELFSPTSLLISAIAGFLVGIPTGPARFFVVDTWIKEGRGHALRVYVGLLASKLLYAALALVANDFISSHRKVESIVYLVASLLLMVWGVFIAIKSGGKSKETIELNKDASLFTKGFVVGISNPAIPFIYLAFVQVIKAYGSQESLLYYLINIATFEAVSFITIAVISLLLLSNKKSVLAHWGKVEFIMGVFIFSIGAYQVYEQLDFSDGIHIKTTEHNGLEKQLDSVKTKIDKATH